MQERMWPVYLAVGPLVETSGKAAPGVPWSIEGYAPDCSGPGTTCIGSALLFSLAHIAEFEAMPHPSVCLPHSYGVHGHLSHSRRL